MVVLLVSNMSNYFEYSFSSRFTIGGDIVQVGVLMWSISYEN